MVRVVAALLSVVVLAAPAIAQTGSPEGVPTDLAGLRKSVVKIHSTIRQPDMVRPWQKGQPQEATGSGFVIDGNRIVTNAHVVNYARRVFVQPNQSSDRLEANVVAIDTGIDLAILQLEDESFFADHPPLELTDVVPQVGATVNVLGYPLGGEALSVTEGVLSRVEYSPFFEDIFGLQMQIDAPINPGNSGGPAFNEGRVIGVVFSKIDNAENIGYVIPSSEIELFLEQTASGGYVGRPQFFDFLQEAENPALRLRAGMTDDVSGIIVMEPEGKLDGENEAEGDDEGGEPYPLQRWDVLTKIGDYDIDNAGMIQWDKNLRLHYEYAALDLIENGRVPMTVFRDGETMDVMVPARPHRDLLFKPLKDRYPRFFVFGPMVFTPAYDWHTSRGQALGWLASRGSPLAQRTGDTVAFEGEELVVLASPVLPHRITKSYDLVFFPTLKAINGVEVKNLRHAAELCASAEGEFIEFTWYDGGQPTVVYELGELEDASEEILEENGIRSAWSDDLADVFE